MVIHLITFPDWTQPENLLYQDLVSLINKVRNFQNTNLLIDITGITQEEAELIFSSVITSLTLEESLEISDSLELKFLHDLTSQDWEYLKSHLHQRIYLKNDRPSPPVHNKYFCPVCHNDLINFQPLSQWHLDKLSSNNWNYDINDLETLNYNQYSCPLCSASDRDRLYALYLQKYIKNWSVNHQAQEIFRIVDFAPSHPLSLFIRKTLNSFLPNQHEYRTADLMMSGVDDLVDLTDMKVYEDNYFDFWICSHILEHIPDDIRAMRELYRILRKNGLGIAMVPLVIGLEETDENPTVIDIGERWRRFGQGDHIRQYSKKGFLERIARTGFQINEITESFFQANDFIRSGITTKSILYIVNK